MISGGDWQARAAVAVAAEDKEDDMRIHIALTLALVMILGLACPQAAARAAEEGSYAATAEIAAETEEEIYAEAGAAVEEAVPETVEEEILAEIPEEAGATAEEAAIDETEAEALEAAEAPVPQNGIPVVIIEIDESEGNNTIEDMNASEDHSVKCTGTMQIIVPEGFAYCDMDAAPESLGPVDLEYIRGRGHTTWEYPKKPYRIKLDKKANVLGLGESKHWVLLANCLDETLIKDRLIGVLGDALGFEYTPNGVPVDVVMIARKDGEEVSRESLGSYLLAEQVRVDKTRVNIPELTAEDTEPEDITGGYLMAYGHQLFVGDPDKFYTEYGQMLANDTPTFDPEDDDYTNEQQKAYIRDHIQKMENALYGDGSYEDGDDAFADGEGVRYNEYMDMESAAKYWLLQEVSANWDGYGSGSAYFYKKADKFDDSGNVTKTGKVYWGPLWDFDVSFGDEGPDQKIEGFSFIGDKWIAPMVYDEDSEGFRRTAQKLWPEVREAVLDAVSDGGPADRYYEETKSSYEADYEIWKDSSVYYDERREDYRQNIDSMKQWTRARVAWIDAHMSGTADDGEDTLDSAVARVTYVVDSDTVRREYYPKGTYCYVAGSGSSSGSGAGSGGAAVPGAAGLTTGGTAAPGAGGAARLAAGENQPGGGFIPEKEGYVFKGWLDEEGNLLSGDQYIEEDRIFTASFESETAGRPVEEIIFRSDEEASSLGEVYYYSKFTVLPQDAQDKTLTWESSEPEIADVDEQGEVHMFRTGTVTITATAKSGVTSSYTLQIVDQQPVPEDLVLDTDTIELAAGEHAKITYTVVPSGAKSENVRFTSDDDGVASVDSNGVVFGERAGMAAITVTLRYLDEDGEFVTIERTCLVHVYGEEEEPDEPDEREEQDCGPGQHDLVKRNAVSPTCLENGIREYWACRVCGKLFADAEGFDEISAGETIIEALGHDWGDWKVVEKATAGREGLEERVCGRCGEKEQRSVPRVSSGRDDTDTGDKSNPGLWILLAAAALAGIGGVIVLRRRK